MQVFVLFACYLHLQDCWCPPLSVFLWSGGRAGGWREVGSSGEVSTAVVVRAADWMTGMVGASTVPEPPGSQGTTTMVVGCGRCGERQVTTWVLQVNSWSAQILVLFYCKPLFLSLPKSDSQWSSLTDSLTIPMR